MEQYLKLARKILTEGVVKESGRANMPPTQGISFGHIEMDLRKGFPLLTTKKMFWKGIIHELLWFLRGDTNIKYLVDNKVNVWNKDAYGWYKTFAEDNGGLEQNGILKDNGDGTLSMYNREEFVEAVRNTPADKLPTYVIGVDLREKHHGATHYKLGDLGKVYGHQWRNQNGVDQIAGVVKSLQENPYSRYHIIDGWNKADFSEMALPPCHLLYQFTVAPLTTEERLSYMRSMTDEELVFPTETLLQNVSEGITKILDTNDVPKFYLDLNMYQRSCDTLLGVPFNIASMSAMIQIFAEVSNMIPRKANWIGGDTHIYVPHIPIVRQQLARSPGDLPTLVISRELYTLQDILQLSIDDFELKGYVSQDKLDGKLYTGLKEDWGDDE